MYAQIIPVKRGKIDLPFFDYEVPEAIENKIHPGQLVLIPLRSKTEFGIVRSLSNTSTQGAKIKSIAGIAVESPLLSPESLFFMEEIANLYHASLGLVVKSSLLPLKKRKLAKLEAVKFPPKTGIFTKPELFVYQNADEKKNFLKSRIAEKGQILIIVPEAADIKNLSKILAEYADEIIEFSSYDSEKIMFDSWVKVWRGEKRIVIGTRSALFLSFFELETIIVDDEAHQSHKSWDMAPRFHARDAALIAGKYYKTSVVFSCSAPGVESYYFTERKIYELKSQSALPGKIGAEIIDLKNEKRSGNYSSISFELENAIREAENDVFVFCNRLGSAGYISCRDCETTLNCSSCHRPLAYHESGRELQCHHCGNRQPMTSVCSNCGGIRLARYGAGSEKIAGELRKLFGSTTPVLQIDSSTDGIEHLSKPGKKIIVGTALAWPHIDWSRLSITAFADMDTPLFIPEFRMVEQVALSLFDAAFRLNNNGRLIIQTSHPEHAIFTALHDPKKFYEGEIVERKTFGYPPFKYLLKLFYGHTDPDHAEAEAARLRTELSRLTKTNADIKISAVLNPLPPRKNGKVWKVIIIKLPYSSYKKTSREILNILPEGWKADPGPNSLLSI